MKDKVFSNIVKRLAEVKKLENLTVKEIRLLSTPKRIAYTKLKIGKKTYPAWRILFSDALGPGKGGIRFHPGVCQDEVKSLSFWMTLKNSLAGLPYGGAKGGVQFDPRQASDKELQQVSRKFIDAFYKYLGQDKDIPAPDVYTNSQIMAWMLDEYEKKVGYHQPGMITGKPLDLQGCVLRGDATAKGAFIITKAMLKKFKLNKKKLKVAVQGFGNAGLFMSQMLAKDGFRVVAVSDSKGGIYSKTGLNIKKVIAIKKKQGSVTKHKQGQVVTNAQLLELPVDILVLAALENQVTKDNAKDVKAKYIVEVANGPTTYDADQILFKKGTMVVPDILANSGGVTVSYFEWAQNRTGNILDKDYLAKLLETKMLSSWNKMMTVYREHDKKIDLRASAYIIAIRRILSAERLRGNL
ncbi:glutamate dehydrogenase [Candidatus Shapirobacteria bacterium]|nr:MAG: glutamate dehydrogenase [Candidatus Shapirobacteria bacterium]